MPIPNEQTVTTIETADEFAFYDTSDVLHPRTNHITAFNAAASFKSLAGLNDPLRPTGAIRMTMQRTNTIANVASLTSGQLYLVGINLIAGDVVTSITFMSGTQAAVTPTAQLFGLYSSARALRATSADATSAAWAANSIKTLAMVTPYTITTTGLHYIGLSVVAGTVPSLLVQSVNALVSALVPIHAGTSDGSLTTTLPATATAITAATSVPFAYVS